ncbi:beta strand repeat-containing protein, partial [Azospirillum picis]
MRRQLRGGVSSLPLCLGWMVLAANVAEAAPCPLAGPNAILSAACSGPISANAFTGLSITSTGTIAGGATGVSNSGIILGTLTNSGTINGSSNAAVVNSGRIDMLLNGSVINSGMVGVSNRTGGTIGTLTNNGRIAGGHADAIENAGNIGKLDNAGTIDSDIWNSGRIDVITNSGRISTSSTAIINGGTIGTLTNSGTIMASKAISTSGLLGTITNSGMIAGHISSTSTNTLLINGGSGSTFGTLTGVTGSITSSDMGTIGSSRAGVVFASGNLLLNDHVSVGSNTVTNSGATLKIVNPVTITGSYSQTGGTLTSKASNPSTYAVLNVSGDATVTNSTVVISGAGLSDGNSFTIVRAGGTGSYVNDTALVDGTTGLTAAVTTVNNRLVVTLVSGSVSPPPPPPPPPSPPAPPPPPPVVVSPPSPPPPVVVPPPVTGVIDTSKGSFGNTDGAVRSSTVTFDGGTLKPFTALTLAQAVTITGNSGTIDPNGTAVILSGGVGGPGALTVAGPGSVTVSGTVANGGGIAVRQGVLGVTSGGAVTTAVTVGAGGSVTVGSHGTISGNLTASGGTIAVGSGGIVKGALAVDGGTASVSGIVAAPVTVSNGGSVVVNAGGGIAGAGLSVANGSVTVARNGIVSAPVTVNGGGTATVDGAVMAPVTVTGGSLAVETTGSTGAITVDQGGAARVNGIAASTVDVKTGSTLGGSGTILGATTVAGTLSPGNSPGVLTVQSAVTLTGTSVYRAEIDGPTAGSGAGHHDQVAVQGASLTAAGTLAPVLRGIAGSATNAYTATLGQSFAVVTASGGVLGS